jgi:fatty acid desaturase
MIPDASQYAPPMLPGLSNLSDGRRTYGEFRKTLSTPYLRARQGVIWTWVGIITCQIVVSLVEIWEPFVLILMLTLSLLQHRIMNVLHEGSHFLLAKSRKGNDLFSNIFSGWFVFADVKAYRKLHIQHHKNLGSELDPKKSHMEKLDFTLLAAAFSGFGSFRILLQRRNYKMIYQETNPRDGFTPIVPALGLVLHAIIVLGLVNIFGSRSALIWIICTVFITPGLGIVRNILEHRYVESIDLDVWNVLMGKTISIEDPQQVTTRIFTTSRLSSVWGSMGFTRHLLHHWDPSISFLNLDKVHEFLLNTQIGEQLKAMDTTFASTFIHLWGKDNHADKVSGL